jgi:hypothetical protein
VAGNLPGIVDAGDFKIRRRSEAHVLVSGYRIPEEELIGANPGLVNPRNLAPVVYYEGNRPIAKAYISEDVLTPYWPRCG